MIDEQRVDQVVGRQMRFADEVAEPGMAAEPSGPMKRETGGGLKGHRATPRGQQGLFRFRRAGVADRRTRRLLRMKRARRKRRSAVRDQWPRLCGGAGAGCRRTSLPLASKHSIFRCSAAKLSWKPIWIVIWHSGSSLAISLRLRLLKIGGHAGIDGDRRSGGSLRGGWPARAAA